MFQRAQQPRQYFGAVLPLAMRRPSVLGGMALLVVAVLLAPAALPALEVAAQAQGAGILEGQVVNGTAGGPQAGAGMAVTLRVYPRDTEVPQAQVDALETTTDASGSFRFEGLDTDTSLEYRPEVVYLQVPYTSAEPYRFDDARTPSAQTTLTATITVYETTDDDSAVDLDSIHLIAESFGEVLRISEIHLFGNAGDRTYVGRAGDEEQATTVHIPLPGNAVGLAFQESTSDERFIEVEGGLMDTGPVLPGEETSLAFFSYHLMATTFGAGSETITLERRFAYPVSSLNVLVAQPGLDLRSEQLTARGLELFQGRQYAFYGTEDLAADTPLVMELVPVPDEAGGQSAEGASATGGQNVTVASARGNQEVLRWLGFGLLGLAVIGAVVYALARGRAPATSADVVASTPDLFADPESRRLLADLADLEEAFEAGQVDGATYERRRAELFEALKSA